MSKFKTVTKKESRLSVKESDNKSKVGRKAMPKHERKDKPVQCLLTQEEYKSLVSNANHEKVGAYMRRILKEAGVLD